MTSNHTDHQLRTAITEELMWTPNVTADHIGIAVTEGAVTLSGEVESYPEKAAAVRASLRVRGVVGLADEIVVKNGRGPRQDVDIARDAGTALNASVELPFGSVQATVHDHEVNLTGTVAWHYQREAAERLVAALPGVSGVHNGVTLRPTLPSVAARREQRRGHLLGHQDRDDRDRHLLGGVPAGRDGRLGHSRCHARAEPAQRRRLVAPVAGATALSRSAP